MADRIDKLKLNRGLTKPTVERKRYQRKKRDTQTKEQTQTFTRAWENRINRKGSRAIRKMKISYEELDWIA